MNNQQKKALYIVILLFLISMQGGMFCYFMGKTDTLGEAFSQFIDFAKWIFPVFIVCFSLVLYDLRKLNRKNEE
jgi:hypothetical protein